MRHWRALLIAMWTALAVAAGGAGAVHAEDRGSAAAAAPAAPENEAEAAKEMEGCPRQADGSCCGSCQQAKPREPGANDAGGGCPCQKARAAKRGS
jgi:hypothetical protein